MQITWKLYETLYYCIDPLTNYMSTIDLNDMLEKKDRYLELKEAIKEY